MTKDIYDKDFYASRIISFNNQLEGYDRVYYKTTEDLTDLLDIDFYNKDVLTVLGSSDQYLTAKYLDANIVDSFDKNRLTLYYFYLRIWTLKYSKYLYPQVLDNNTWLTELLKIIKPSTLMEKRALDYYKRHIIENTNLYNLFYNLDLQPEGKTIFTKNEELQDCLDSNLVFYIIDLFEKVNIDKTYDILLISNILDWARNDPKKLEIARNNIHKLLRKDGVAMCTRLINKPDKEIEKEKEIFSDLFTYEKHNKSYSYTKK